MELSFAASTRARYLTLNAPVVRPTLHNPCSHAATAIPPTVNHCETETRAYLIYQNFLCHSKACKGCACGALSWCPDDPCLVCMSSGFASARCVASLCNGLRLSIVTDTKSITSIKLDPALQNCAYLCNMAVDANYRRRGYGNILLDAADDVAKLAGETQIYLHLR